MAAAVAKVESDDQVHFIFQVDRLLTEFVLEYRLEIDFLARPHGCRRAGDRQCQSQLRLGFLLGPRPETNVPRVRFLNEIRQRHHRALADACTAHVGTAKLVEIRLGRKRTLLEIEVLEGESSSSSFIVAIGIIILLTLLIVIAMIFFLMRKKRMDEEERRREEEAEKEVEDEFAEYEELYGIPAPVREEEEEELTTEELRDRIHEQIERLEHMEM